MDLAGCQTARWKQVWMLLALVISSHLQCKQHKLMQNPRQEHIWMRMEKVRLWRSRKSQQWLHSSGLISCNTLKWDTPLFRASNCFKQQQKAKSKSIQILPMITWPCQWKIITITAMLVNTSWAQKVDQETLALGNFRRSESFSTLVQRILGLDRSRHSTMTQVKR